MYSLCLNLVVSRGGDRVNIGGGTSIELFDMFCYLRDYMLSVDGIVDKGVACLLAVRMRLES